MLPGICPPHFPLLLVFALVPFSTPTPPGPHPPWEGESGRLTVQQGGEGCIFYNSCSKYPRTHSHWMELGHVPIPEPTDRQTGVRQAGGWSLCHRIPSEAGGVGQPQDLELGLLPGEPQDLQPRGPKMLRRLFPGHHASLLEAPQPLRKVKSVSSQGFFFSPGDCFLRFYK